MKDLSKVKSILASVRAKGNLFSPKVLAVGAVALGLSGALSFVAPFRGVAEAAAGQTLNGSSSGAQYLDADGNATTTKENAVVEVEGEKRVNISAADSDSEYSDISNGSFTGVQLTITGGTWLNVLGGFSNSDANCSNNVVTIDGTEVVTKDIFAAYSLKNSKLSGKVTYTNNKVYIKGGTIQGAVSAFPSTHGKTSNNVIYWSGGTICGRAITGDEIIITGGTFSGENQESNITASDYVQLGDKAKGTTGTLTIAGGTLKIASGVDYVDGSTISIGSGAIFFVEKKKEKWKLDGKGYTWFDGDGENQGTKYYSFAKKLTLTGAGSVDNAAITIGNEDSVLTLEGNLTITQIQGIGTVTVADECIVNTTLKTWTDEQVLIGATLNEKNETLNGGTMGTPTGTLRVTNNGTVAKSGTDTAYAVNADGDNIPISVTGGSLSATATGGTKSATAAVAYASNGGIITLNNITGITANATGAISVAYGVENEGSTISVTGGSLSATATGTTSATAAGAYVSNGGTITLKNVTGISGTTATGATSAKAYGIDNEGSGTVTITNDDNVVTVISATANGDDGTAYGIEVKEKEDLETATPAKVTISGGTTSITATASSEYATAFGVDVYKYAEVNLEGIQDITAVGGKGGATGVKVCHEEGNGTCDVVISLGGTISATSGKATETFGVSAYYGANVTINGNNAAAIVAGNAGTALNAYDDSSITVNNVANIESVEVGGTRGCAINAGGDTKTGTVTVTNTGGTTTIIGDVKAEDKGVIKLENVAVTGNVAEVDSGTISFDGSVSINGNLTMKNELNIGSGDILSLTGGTYTLNNGGTNAGTLNLNGGTNGSTIVGKNKTLINTNGTINVTGGSVTIEQNHMTISGGTIKVAEGSTFFKSNKLEGVTVANSGTVILGGTLSEPIIGGTFKTTGTATVTDGGLLKDTTVIVGYDTTKSSSLIVQGGTVNVEIKALENAQKSVIFKINCGAVTVLKPVYAEIDIEKASSPDGPTTYGTLYIDVDNVKGLVKNKSGQGSLNLTSDGKDGDTLTQEIQGFDSQGGVSTTNIKGDITADADLFTVYEGQTTNLNVVSGKVLTFKGIDEDTSGTLISAITTGTTGGTYKIASGYTLTANTALNGAIDNDGTLTIDAGNVKGAVDNSGTVALTGGSLTQTVTGGTLSITGAVTSAAENILGATNTIANKVNLTLAGGTLSKALEGAGGVKIQGEVNADASYFTNGGMLLVTDGNTLTLKAGTLGHSVNGDGNVVIDGEVSAAANYFAAYNILSVNANKILTLTGYTLGTNVDGDGKVVIDGEVSSNAGNFKQTGGLEIKDAADTLTLTGGTLKTTASGAGKIVIGGTVTADAAKFTQTGDLYVNDSKVLILDGTLSKQVTGSTNANAGTIAVASGKTLTTDAANLGVAVTNDGTIALTGGSLSSTITGGTLTINGNVTTDATKIAGGTNEIASGKTLTLNTGILGGTLSGAGNVVVDGTVSTNAGYLANSGTVTVGADDTLDLTGGTLAKDITNSGTIKLEKDATIGNTVTAVTGTLTGANGKVDMSGDSAANTLTITTLAGTINLGIDVNWTTADDYTLDKLSVTNAAASTVINLDSINVTTAQDVTLTDGSITYVSSKVPGVTYNVGGSTTGSITSFSGDYIYTFTPRTDANTIYLDYTVAKQEISFADFVAHESKETYNLAMDTTDGHTSDQPVAQGTSTKTVNLNGNTLGEVGSTFTVTTGNGQTMNINGGSASTEGIAYTKWEVESGGTLAISGKTDLKGYIDNSGTMTVASGAAVTFDGGVGNGGTFTNSGTAILNGKLSGTGSWTNGGTMTINNDIAMSGGTVTNNGTMNLNGTLGVAITNNSTLNISGTLNANVNGTEGTTVLAGTTKVISSVAIEGTLNGNNQTLDMTNGAANTLTIGTFGGTMNLAIDVGISGDQNSDKLAITTGGGTLNVTSVNLVSDITSGTDVVTYATTTTGTNVYEVNGTTGGELITVTGGSTASGNSYKFTAGSAGKLTCVITAVKDGVTFEKFVTGQLKDSSDTAITATTLSLVDKMADATATMTPTALTVYLNGKSLGETANANTVTVDSGMTMNLVGDNSSDGSQNCVYTKWNVGEGGTLNVSGTVMLYGVVDGAEGSAKTYGTFTNSGKLVTDATNIQHALTNNGTVVLRDDSTAGQTLQATISGGTVEIYDNVTSAADYIKGKINTIRDDITLTLTGGSLTAAVSGGTVAIGVDGTPAKVVSSAAIGSAISVVSGNTLTIGASNVGGAVTNSGTVNLQAGTLNYAVTNGTLNITEDVTSAAGNIKGSENNIADNKTLTLTDGSLSADVSGGAVMVKGAVTSSASIASAITVVNGASLTIGAANVDGAVTNNGTVNLGEGILQQTVTGGTLYINGNVSSNASYIAGATNQIKSGNTLTLTGGTLAGDLTRVTDYWGDVTIAGDVTNNKSIANDVTINAGATLTNGGTISGAITNAGTLKVAADKVRSAVTNYSGSNKGTVELGAGTLSGGTITGGTVKLTGDVSTTGDKLADGTSGNEMALNLDGNTLTITSGNLAVQVGDSTNSTGTLNISGQVGVSKAIYTAVTNSGTLAVDAGNVKGAVTNNGTINLGQGTLENTITGGVLNIGANVTSAAGNIAGDTNAVALNMVLTLTTGTLGAAVTGSGKIEVENGNILTTAAENLGVAVTNGGTVALSGGSLTKTVTGGELQINGDVTSAAGNILGATNTVASGKVLTLSGTLGKAVTGSGTIAVNSGSILTTAAANLGVAVTNAGTIQLNGGSLTKDITGGTVVVNGATIDADNLKGTMALTVLTGGTLIFSGDGTAETPDVLADTITTGATGTYQIAAGKYLTSETALNSAIDNDGTLTIGANNVKGNVDNSDTVNLKGGTLTFTITGGTLNITGDVTADAGKILGDTNNVDSGKVLTLFGSLSKKIEGYGTMAVASGSTLTTAAENLGVAVDNSGTVELSGGTLGAKVTGGLLNVTGKVTAAAGNIAGDTNQVASDATLTLKGGTMAGSITTTDGYKGTVAISGEVDTGDNTIANVLVINSDGTLKLNSEYSNAMYIDNNGTLEVSATNLQANVDNKSGTVKVTGTTTEIGGTTIYNDSLSKTISGGTVELTTVKFAGSNLKSVNKLTLDNAQYSLTFDIGTATVGTSDVIGTVTGGTVGGSLVFGDISLTGTRNDDWEVNEEKNVSIVSNTVTGTFTIAKEVIATNKNTYTFKQSSEAGCISVTKGKPTDLKDIVTDPEGVGTFALEEDYVAENDLGTLKSTDDAGRTLTIEGTTTGHYDYIGSNHEGMKLDNENDELNLQNLGNIAAWKDNVGVVTNNKGTVNISTNATTTLSSYLLGAGAYNLTGGTLDVTDAKYLAMTGEKGISNSGTINLQGGTLGATITGGTLNIQGEVSADADYVLANTTVDTSKTLTLTEGTLVSDVTITNGGTVALDSKAILAGSVTGGTLEVIGTGTEIQYKSVDSNIVFKEGTDMTANLNGGTITMEGITIKGQDDNGVETVGGTFTVKNGTTLVFNNETKNSIMTDVVVETNAVMDPVVSVFAEGVNVYVKYNGEEESNGGKLILEPGTLFATIHQEAGSVIETTAESIDWGSEAVPNTNDKILFEKVTDVSQLDIAAGNLQFSDNAQKWHLYKVVSGTAVENGTLTEANLWSLANIQDNGKHLVTTAKFGGDYLMPEYYNNGSDIAVEIRNIDSLVEKNTSALAGVQQGALSMVNQAADVLGDNLSLRARPAQSSKYDKTIWANYISSKDTTEGLAMEGIAGGNNNTAQYHGVTVGADLYTSKKAIAGIALTYVSGDVTGNTLNTQLNNKTKYYGVTLYDRVNNGPVAWTYDIGYQNGKNEISQYACEEVTADAKTDALTAGIKVEQAFNFKHSTFAPFASFRYVRLQNKDYSNSNGAQFQTDNQNLFMPKFGLAWNGEYKMPKCGWSWQPSAEVGYLWNMGNTDVQGSMYMNTRNFTMDYDTMDRSSFYAKLGMNFILKNFTAGLAYRYSTGDSITNSKWNVNVSWKF